MSPLPARFMPARKTRQHLSGLAGDLSRHQLPGLGGCSAFRSHSPGQEVCA